jgi:CBS domain-containing protein
MICPRCGYDNLPGNDDCTKCLLDLAQLDVPTGVDRVQASLISDQIIKLKPRSAATIPDDATLQQAVATMAELGESSLMVVNREGRLLGVLSERDVIHAVEASAGALAERRTADCMMVGPVAVAPDDSLARALQRMDVGGYRHLPVVADGKPVGLISVHDLVLYLTDLCKD